MKRPVTSRVHARANRASQPRGYTMIEILMATVLMLIIMLAVAWVFGMVGESISDSRSTLQMSGELRTAATRLSQDLKGASATRLGKPWKRQDPGENQGYLEIIEGAIGPIIPPNLLARNNDLARVPLPVVADLDQYVWEGDATVGDIDDVLMLTTDGNGEVFIGRAAIKVDPTAAGVPLVGQDDWDRDGTPDDYGYVFETIEADAAEVIWFVRGRTLFRRVLLIKPGFPENIVSPFNLDLERRDAIQRTPMAALQPAGFYNNDVSIRREQRLDRSTGSPVWPWVMAANGLVDLTKRENRFAHRSRSTTTGARTGYPYDPHSWTLWSGVASAWRQTFWGTYIAQMPSGDPVYEVYAGLGMPTLRECSHRNWTAGGPLPNAVVGVPTPAVPLPLTPNQSINPADVFTEPASVFDAWNNPYPYQELDPATGAHAAYMGPRIDEDVILTNVIGFDVKVWDPGAWVLPGVNAQGTISNLAAPSFWTPGDFTDDTVLSGVAVVPGDPGYRLSLAHAIVAVSNTPSADDVFLPVSRGAYVDLDYLNAYYSSNPQTSINLSSTPTWSAVRRSPMFFGNSPFAGPGESRSQLQRVYDTWSTHYESNWLDINLDGIPNKLGPNPANWDLGDENNNGLFDEGANGFDDPGNGLDDDNDGYVDEADETANNGIVDDVWEQEAPAPYPVPLRGIQIKIRVFEPDSRQIREMTIVQDFVTE